METFCWNSRVFEPGVMKEISALVQPAAKPFNIIKPRIHPICAIFSFFFSVFLPSLFITLCILLDLLSSDPSPYSELQFLLNRIQAQ